MTLAELRTFLRRRVNDSRSTRFTDSELNDELNLAAQFIATDVELVAADVASMTGVDTLSISAGTTAYGLNADFLFLRHAIRTDTTPDRPCIQISEAEASHYREQDVAFDEHGRLLFYITSDTTDARSFELPADPKEIAVVSVYYQRAVAAVSLDASEFPLPSILHPMIGLYAAAQLLMADGLPGQIAAADYGARREMMIKAYAGTRRRTFADAVDGIV